GRAPSPIPNPHLVSFQSPSSTSPRASRASGEPYSGCSGFNSLKNFNRNSFAALAALLPSTVSFLPRSLLLSSVLLHAVSCRAHDSAILAISSSCPVNLFNDDRSRTTAIIDLTSAPEPLAIARNDTNSFLVPRS